MAGFGCPDDEGEKCTLSDTSAGDAAAHLKHGGIETKPDGEDHSTSLVCDASVAAEKQLL